MPFIQLSRAVPGLGGGGGGKEHHAMHTFCTQINMIQIHVHVHVHVQYIPARLKE